MPGVERIPLYVALWRGEKESPSRGDALRLALARHYPGLVRHETPLGIELLCRPSTPALAVQSNRTGSLLVIGQVFERGPSRSTPSRRANLDAIEGEAGAIARTLIDNHWGSYLAFLRCPVTHTLSVLRDPSGALPATVIGDERLAVIADQIPRWLHEAVTGPPRIDWELLAAQLRDPSVASHRSFLVAARPVAAGSLASIQAKETPQQLWEPVALAARAVPDDDRLAQHLRYTVRDSVAALTADHERVLLELSGGLDSTILLGCLAGRRGGPPACINMATVQSGGDERVYARAAADRHGATLTEAMLEASEMDYSQLAGQADLSEPRLYGTDRTHERLVGALAEALGASAIVSGQGGDAVFFQEPTPLVAADHLQVQGPGRATWRTIRDSARRSYGTIWSVLVAARAARRRHQLLTLVEHDNLLLGPAARTAPVISHPWLANIEALPPAKRIQLQLLATCQFFRGPTARADHFALIHPLLAQPVAELCFAIPSWRLAFGRLDRGLARNAFAADLPQIIARRRGKGEVSTYFSHAIVANLPFLRDLLLGGLLAQRGLLDSAMLDTALSEPSLVQRPDHRVIIAYASLEGWLRSWS